MIVNRSELAVYCQVSLIPCNTGFCAIGPVRWDTFRIAAIGKRSFYGWEKKAMTQVGCQYKIHPDVDVSLRSGYNQAKSVRRLLL